MVELPSATAVVTGASSGIGAATSRALADHGATVVLAARRADRLESLADEINESTDGAARAVPTDVSDEPAATALIETTVDEYGGLDVLVNNAGTNKGSDVADLETEEYRAMMDVNADGCFFTTRAALPHIVDRSGHLIYVASIAGRYPRSFNPVYAATKWWVRGFAQSVSAQYGDEGVAVSIVNPSEVRSEFVGSDGRLFLDRFEPGEVTAPEEIAEAIVYAARSGRSAPIEIDVYRRDKFADMF